MDTNVLLAVPYFRSVLKLRELVQYCGRIRPEEEKTEIIEKGYYLREQGSRPREHRS